MRIKNQYLRLLVYVFILTKSKLNFKTSLHIHNRQALECDELIMQKEINYQSTVI